MFEYITVTLAGILVGYRFGARRSRVARRNAIKEVNAVNLELLDAKGTLSSLETHAAQRRRKDRLLHLSLRKLKTANQQLQAMRSAISAQRKQHFYEITRLRLQAVESRESAQKAIAIARRATTHLKRLERLTTITQTINVPEPKAYRTGEAATVGLLDHLQEQSLHDSAARESSRESMRLTRLGSSNGSTLPPA